MSPEITTPGKLLVEIYPMISEVYTHLQILEIEGRINIRIDGQIMKISLTG